MINFLSYGTSKIKINPNEMQNWGGGVKLYLGECQCLTHKTTTMVLSNKLIKMFTLSKFLLLNPLIY